MKTPYSNISGKSAIKYYIISDTSISIFFNKSSKTYTYSYARAGKYHVENMKILAARGFGLNSYINKHCRNLYD